MSYQTLEQINGTGIQGLMQTASDAVPIFPALILFGIFVVLAFGNILYTSRRFGQAKMSSSFAVAGLVTAIVAVLMSLIPNFIDPITISFTIILEIAFVFWLFSSSD